MADEDLDRETEGTTETAPAATPARATTVRRSPFAELPAPPERGPAAYVAELIGTFGLVFFIAAVVTLYAKPAIPAAQPGLPAMQPFQDWAVIGIVHGFVLFALIQGLAIVSGAHFNSAVTAAMTAIRQIRPIDAAIYIALQLIGGIAAAFLVKAMFNNPNATGTSGDSLFGAPSVGAAAGGSNTVALGAEALGTFFLVFVIVGVAVNPAGAREWAAFAIGATLAGIEMVFGPVSGGSFNPARAFGPALAGDFTEGAGAWILIWVVGPVIGALLAAFLYFQMFILPGRKGDVGMEPV